MTRSESDDDLLQRFIERFATRGDLVTPQELIDSEEMFPALDAGIDDSPIAFPLWKPCEASDPVAPFDSAYAALPLRFPPLYERLAARWIEFHVPGLAMMYGNWTAVPLETVLRRIASHERFSERLLARGLLPFGSDPGGSFDPICFDCREPTRDGKRPVVRIDHEAVLMQDDDRPWPIDLVAESFREFLKAAAERLDDRPRPTDRK